MSTSNGFPCITKYFPRRWSETWKRSFIRVSPCQLKTTTNFRKRQKKTTLKNWVQSSKSKKRSRWRTNNCFWSVVSQIGSGKNLLRQQKTLLLTNVGTILLWKKAKWKRAGISSATKRKFTRLVKEPSTTLPKIESFKTHMLCICLTSSKEMKRLKPKSGKVRLPNPRPNQEGQNYPHIQGNVSFLRSLTSHTRSSRRKKWGGRESFSIRRSWIQLILTSSAQKAWRGLASIVKWILRICSMETSMTNN